MTTEERDELMDLINAQIKAECEFTEALYCRREGEPTAGERVAAVRESYRQLVERVYALTVKEA